MTELITRSGAWLLLQAAALPDTLVMKTVAAQRGWFETVTGVASSIMTVTLVLLAAFLAPAAWSFWRTFRKVREIIDRVYADITPITHHASSIADNLDYITTSIRSDVQQVNATIASANRRLHQAVELTETRLNDFNALLKVVQQEAEQAFVSTASAVRGVRTGAATLSGIDDTFDEDGAGGGDYDDGDNDSDEDSEQIDNGTGERIERGAGAARPRLRSRRQRPG
jgi:uncharacterized protein YoxC